MRENENDKYLSVALGVARESSEIAKKYFLDGTMQSEWKADNTPVTLADKEINSLVIKKIQEIFPSHSIQGEEESSKVEGSDYVWICDPIDGTIPFSLGLPFFSFSLALVQNGIPIVGVVNLPIMNQLIYAQIGKGAFMNGKKLETKTDTTISKSSIFFTENWGNSLYRTTKLIEELAYNHNAKVLGLLSAVYGGVQIALGKADGIIFPGNTTHDVAALAIIIQEAGGKTSDISGNEQQYGEKVNGFIGSNGGIHTEIVSLVKEHLFKNNNFTDQ